MKIYTKTGDRGQTSLYGGTRVSKDNTRVETYGTVDELNSAIGVAIAQVQNSRLRQGYGGQAKFEIRNEGVKNILENIQSDLFFIGAMLAGDRKDAEARNLKLEARTQELEKMIDWMVERMSPQKHFILPGGSIPSAFLQLARSVCRRAERRVVALKSKEQKAKSKNEEHKIIDQSIIYLNRLSDLLYTLARFINVSLNTPEPEWKSTP